MKIKLLNNLKCGVVSPKSMALVFSALLVIPACTVAQQNPTADQPEQGVVGGGTIVIEEGVPGALVVETYEMSSKVIAIDKENRQLTLQDSAGAETKVKAGPEAVNFDQVEVDDMVNVTVTKELIIQLVGEQEATGDGAAGVVALAEEGSQPGGVVGGAVQVTATITAIDQANRTATLSLDDGTSKTIPVREDIDLTQRKVGEKVVFLATEMMAISIERP